MCDVCVTCFENDGCEYCDGSEKRLLEMNTQHGEQSMYIRKEDRQWTLVFKAHGGILGKAIHHCPMCGRALEA